jgi:hypothetical protein
MLNSWSMRTYFLFGRGALRTVVERKLGTDVTLELPMRTMGRRPCRRAEGDDCDED